MKRAHDKRWPAHAQQRFGGQPIVVQEVAVDNFNPVLSNKPPDADQIAEKTQRMESAIEMELAEDPKTVLASAPLERLARHTGQPEFVACLLLFACQADDRLGDACPSLAACQMENSKLPFD